MWALSRTLRPVDALVAKRRIEDELAPEEISIRSQVAAADGWLFEWHYANKTSTGGPGPWLLREADQSLYWRPWQLPEEMVPADGTSDMTRWIEPISDYFRMAGSWPPLEIDGDAVMGEEDCFDFRLQTVSFHRTNDRCFAVPRDAPSLLFRLSDRGIWVRRGSNLTSLFTVEVPWDSADLERLVEVAFPELVDFMDGLASLPGQGSELPAGFPIVTVSMLVHREFGRTNMPWHSTDRAGARDRQFLAAKDAKAWRVARSQSTASH